MRICLLCAYSLIAYLPQKNSLAGVNLLVAYFLIDEILYHLEASFTPYRIFVPKSTVKPTKNSTIFGDFHFQFQIRSSNQIFKFVAKFQIVKKCVEWFLFCSRKTFSVMFFYLKYRYHNFVQIGLKTSKIQIENALNYVACSAIAIMSPNQRQHEYSVLLSYLLVNCANN